jgi:hypothetical protein
MGSRRALASNATNIAAKLMPCKGVVIRQHSLPRIAVMQRGSQFKQFLSLFC